MFCNSVVCFFIFGLVFSFIVVYMDSCLFYLLLFFFVSLVGMVACVWCGLGLWLRFKVVFRVVYFDFWLFVGW